MQVDTSVAEADVGKLEPGHGRDASPSTPTPARRSRATVRQIRNAPQTVQNVVTYDAVIDVENAELKLKPGMTANVTFVFARSRDVRCACRTRRCGSGRRPSWRTPACGGAGRSGGARLRRGGGARRKAAGRRGGEASGRRRPAARRRIGGRLWVLRGPDDRTPVRVRARRHRRHRITEIGPASCTRATGCVTEPPR